MYVILVACLALQGLSSGERASAAPARPRVVVLSDFPPLDVIPVGAGHGPAEKRSDPDDIQSMVRFLLYANEFDVEGLVASAATVANIARKQHILDILDLYDRVDDRLRRRDPRYPTAEALRSGQWLLDTFPNLFVIVSQKTYTGMFAQESPLGNLAWLDANVREDHGPLGAAYPRSGFNPGNPGQQEGDTPSFL